MLALGYLNKMVKSIKGNRSLLAKVPFGHSGNTSDLTDQRKQVTTIEEKRIAVMERSVYIEGVRVLQKQERIGYFFTLLISLALVLLLFAILRLA